MSSSNCLLSNLKILSGNQFESKKNYETIFKKIDIIIREVELQSKDSASKNESSHSDIPPVLSPIGENPYSLLTSSLPVFTVSTEEEIPEATTRPKFGLISFQYRNLEEMALLLPPPAKSIDMNNSYCEISTQCITESLPVSANEQCRSHIGIRADDQEARLKDIKSWRRNLLIKMSP
jgi:hypothetical protein